MLALFDARAARFFLTVLAIVAVLFLLWALRATLTVFVLAIFFAYILEPVVESIRRLGPLRKLSRTAALALVYLFLLGGLGVVVSLVGTAAAKQAGALAGSIGEWAKSHDPLAQIPLPAALEPMRERIQEFVLSQATHMDQKILPMVSAAGGRIVSGLGGAVYGLLVPILAFFFLKEGGHLVESTIGIFTGDARTLIGNIFSDLHVMLGQYIRALLTLSAAVFVTYSLVFSLMGVPYAILCAALAAVLEVIPVVGWITAGAITLLVAGVGSYPHVLWILVFLVVYRLVQDYVLQPYLFGSGVALPPILVFFGVLAGEELAGIPGMFFSVPVIATVRTIYLQLAKNWPKAGAAAAG